MKVEAHLLYNNAVARQESSQFMRDTVGAWWCLLIGITGSKCQRGNGDVLPLQAAAALSVLFNHCQVF